MNTTEEARWVTTRDGIRWCLTTRVLIMPDRVLDLLYRFLRQNGGKLSKRARENEFAALTDDEAVRIEAIYVDV
jgi:predicted DCC family thiol-disulfide oxidoreductase YuxK